MNRNAGKRRNPYIELLRFVFCLFIINYHFYSHYTKNEELLHFFCRGYIADEFFFMVSGFFLAMAAVNHEKDSFTWNLKMTWKRIKKIVFIYYVTWLLCFVGREIIVTNADKSLKVIFGDLINSVYELLFLEMFGFHKGVYSNDVAWFFSALLIISFIIGPWIARYQEKYTLYAAPLLALFPYGTLSVIYDYMYAPDWIIPNTVIHKGIIRALAGINAGAFLYGLFDKMKDSRVLHKNKRVLFIISIILLAGVFSYMIYPFSSNTDEVKIQFDYVFIIVLAIALFLYFVCSLKRGSSAFGIIGNWLGEYSFYIFMGQAVFYSIDKLIYASNISVFLKWMVLNISVAAISLVLMYSDKWIKRIWCR